MTAAYIEALKGFESISGVKDSLLKSESYLVAHQKPDGGFENPSSTSWVLQTLFSNNQILKAEKYLASKQGVDGGVGDLSESIDSRIWVTSYSIPAILHKSWAEILSKFPKQEVSLSKAKEVEIIVSRKEVISKHKNKTIENKEEKIELPKNDLVKTEQSASLNEKKSFFWKVGSFWQNTKHSFGWLISKLSL